MFFLPLSGLCSDYVYDINFENIKLKQSWHMKKYWYNNNNSEKLIKLKVSIGVDGSVANQPGISLDEVKLELQTNLNTYFEKAGMILVDDNPDGLLILNIIEMTQGDRGKRMIAGEFGAGAARLYIDGCLKKKKDEMMVAAFKAHLSDTGEAGLRDIKEDVGPILVKEMSEKVSRNLSKELKRSMKIK